jgi:uncharacterized protein (TIGR03435 family)
MSMVIVKRSMLFAILLSAAFGERPFRFDVASVRRVPDWGVSNHASAIQKIKLSPRGLTMRRVSLPEAIAWAYKITPYQVSGPPWIGRYPYDIVARSQDIVSEERVRDMLRDLLEERFRLKVHRERKNVRVYTLTLAQGGHRMRKADGSEQGTLALNPSGIIAHSATIQQLADALGAALYGPVFDTTGLTARFDFTLDLASVLHNQYDPQDLVEILDGALRRQLGLGLQAKKQAVETLIVDHADATPIEN